MTFRTKALVCSFLLMIFVFPIAGMASATDITPFNTYTSNLTAGLAIGSDKTATVSGVVQGSSSKYSVSGTLSLQQYKNGAWATYQSWPKVSGTGSLAVSKTCKVGTGYKYRTRFVTTVNGETLTKFSAEKTS